MMSAAQRAVVKQVAIALTLWLAFILGLYHWLPWSPPLLATAGDRLAFGLRCEVFAGLMLVAGIGAVANRRFKSPELVRGEPRRLARSPSMHAIFKIPSSNSSLRCSHTSACSRRAGRMHRTSFPSLSPGG
jgi:hypothetical protein